MSFRAVMFGFSAVAFSMQAVADDRLTPLLTYVPADAVGDPMAGEYITFVDLAALRGDFNARVPLFERFGWSPFEQVAGSMSRLGDAPMMIAEYQQYGGLHEFASMADYLGFGWSDIEAAVGFYKPPGSVTVLIGTPMVSDAAVVGPALTARGFSEEVRAEYPFWWRMEDNQLDLQNRDPEDPLRGALGGSARVGLIDGAFVTAANWAAIDATLGVHAFGAGSVADEPDIAAVAFSLNQPVSGEGDLLQAVIFGGAFSMHDVVAGVLGRNATPEAVAALEERLAPASATEITPRYNAFALADRQEGNQAIGVVALVYDTADEAEMAARTVSEAFASLDSLVAQRPFREMIPGAVSTQVTASPDGTRHVASIAFATELALPDGPMARTRTPYIVLIDMLLRLDVAPLAAGDY